MLIINRYTCPSTHKITSQAHVIDADFNITQSFPKMDNLELMFFTAYKYIIINDVARSAMLDSVNIIKQ